MPEFQGLIHELVVDLVWLCQFGAEVFKTRERTLKDNPQWTARVTYSLLRISGRRDRHPDPGLQNNEPTRLDEGLSRRRNLAG